MKSYVEKANTDIVKALSTGDGVAFAKVGEYYVVTVRPFFVAHILKENQVFFAIDKVSRAEKLVGMFTNLLNIEKTVSAENRVTPTGTYFSAYGKDFLKEYGGENNKVWLNANFTKDIESMFPTFYQESAETAGEKNREVLPVLAFINGKPARIIVPARKY